MSSLAPGDSVSTASGRGKKPGKRERNARRSATGAPSGMPASHANAATFASSAMDSTPLPQPGRFPVVFQTGAGEPSRDQTFSLDGPALAGSLASFPGRFVKNAKFAEFATNADIEPPAFARSLVTSSLLALAQQIVHAHVNIGLPLGDFGPVATADIRIPASIAAFLRQYGEFAVPSLGTRYLLAGYEETVTRIIHLADKVSEAADGDPLRAVFGRFWLPHASHDRHTKLLIAEQLNVVLRRQGLELSAQDLANGVLSGEVPGPFRAIRPLLGPAGDAPNANSRFDWLFNRYETFADFANAASTPRGQQSRVDLGFGNGVIRTDTVDWAFNVKQRFTRLADAWARTATTYAQFFELSSGLTNRAAASGSMAQMALVRTVDEITVVSTTLALSAPEFSLAACFPASGVFTGGLVRRVVVTTPLPVSLRATEFCQLDWH